jgi:hypothetical protein
MHAARLIWRSAGAATSETSAPSRILAVRRPLAAGANAATISCDVVASPGPDRIPDRRFPFDYLPGGILNVRGRVRNHMVDATRDDLARERAAIERGPTTAPAQSRMK